MIVSCEKCTKKFNIRDDLIPDEGRLLQCGSCNHKWFYELPNQNLYIGEKNTDDLTSNESVINQEKKFIEKIVKKSMSVENKKIINDDKKNINKTSIKLKKNSNFLKQTIVLIISIIALIILIDTFKFQIEKYIPGINLALNNLYETLKDLSLFAKDLIN